MGKVYKFRRTSGRGAVWLAVAAVIGLGALANIYHTLELYVLLGLAILVCLVWLLIPRPVFGIRLDDTHLTVAAWRKPRHIPLDDIAYLQAATESAEGGFLVVYKDGTQEEVFALDLPDEDTLVEVMAERGIPVRGGV